MPAFALRAYGTARISTDRVLLQRLAMDGKSPQCLLEIRVETVFFQCARAMQRSRLWSPSGPQPELPSAGAMLQVLTDAEIDGAAYNRALPARQRASLY